MQSKDEIDQLFPMPLTSMEKFHWYDSAAGFTNQVFGRFRFRGIIDSEAAQKAADIVIARHPLLTARVVSNGGKLCWVQAPELTPQIVWDDKLTAAPGPRPLDMQNKIPWQVICRNDERETELWFYMSHVVGDGLAGVQIISDWMKCYHQQITGSSKIKGFHRLDPQALKQRNHLGLTKPSYLKHLWKQPIALFGASKFIFRKPDEFVFNDSQPVDWDATRQPAVIGVWIDRPSVDSIKQFANEIGVSINTILVANLMKTLELFLSQQASRESKWIRIILPMNIRTFADRRMPATNRATIVQMDRSAFDFKRTDFLAGLHQEIQIIRDWELGKLFLISIRAMNAIPGAIRRAAANPKCRGTAVFANLAEPFGRMGLPVEDSEMVIGNLKLKEFDFVGPIRNRMPVNFTAQRHLGRIRISMHYDPRVLEPDLAEQIIQKFRQQCVDCR